MAATTTTTITTSPAKSQPQPQTQRPQIVRTAIDFSQTALADDYSGYYAQILDNVFSAEECASFITAAASSSPGTRGEAWEPAKLGARKTRTDFRHSDRILLDDAAIAELIFERVKPSLLATGMDVFVPPPAPAPDHTAAPAPAARGRGRGHGRGGTGRGGSTRVEDRNLVGTSRAQDDDPTGTDTSPRGGAQWSEVPWYTALNSLPPKKTGQWRLIGLNERLRFLRYGPGMYFRPHVDGKFYDNRGAMKKMSFLTLHLYLNGSDDHGGEEEEGPEGGATRFWTKDKREYIDVEPKVGRVLLFQQRGMLHSGEEVTAGLKYTIRTDAMYELELKDEP